MTYEQIKNLHEKEFKRLCGVKPKLFDEMVDIAILNEFRDNSKSVVLILP